MEDIYSVLQKLNIAYEKYEHPAVYTVKDAKKYDIKIDACKTKNLFLRNKKGNAYYLVIIDAMKKADLKKLASLLDENRLGFASPEKLKEYLDLTPGSVSPFGLINDDSKTVKVIVDQNLLKHERLGFHPNINTATLTIEKEDFKKFLKWAGNKILYLEI